MPKRCRRSNGTSEIIHDYKLDNDDNENVPNPDSYDFYHDDIDELHLQKEKILLNKGFRKDEAEESASEEEVLPILSDDDEDDLSDDEIAGYHNQMQRIKQAHICKKMGSDLEDSDEGLPDSKAWGSRRAGFYGTDVVDNRIDLEGSEDEEGVAALEEKEALAIQKRMADELDDQDFALDVFKAPPRTDNKSEDQEKIVKDLSKLSKREKLELLKKESPELLTLIQEFTDKMTELRDSLQPLMNLVNDGKIQEKEAKYIQVKYQLYLNYCVNVSFYLMLKAKHAQAHSHPVIKRLVQYRHLMKQLESTDKKLKPQIVDIVERLKQGEEIDYTQADKETKINKSKKLEKTKKLLKKRSGKVSDEILENNNIPKKKQKSDRYEKRNEKKAVKYYKMMKEDEDNETDEEENEEEVKENVEEEELEADGKRAITYQMAKNKGLTPHKKKELRNPRVKHRMKYRKAKIRRKGQIREVRTEIKPYGGELSGIRAGIKRSIKLK